MFKMIKIKTFRSFMIMSEFPKLQTRLFISALGFVQCHILYGVVQKVTMCVHSHILKSYWYIVIIKTASISIIINLIMLS